MNPKVNFFFRNSERWQEEMEKLRTIVLDCDTTTISVAGVPLVIPAGVTVSITTRGPGAVVLAGSQAAFTRLFTVGGTLELDNLEIENFATDGELGEDGVDGSDGTNGTPGGAGGPGGPGGERVEPAGRGGRGHDAGRVGPLRAPESDAGIPATTAIS